MSNAHISQIYFLLLQSMRSLFFITKVDEKRGLELTKSSPVVFPKFSLASVVELDKSLEEFIKISLLKSSARDGEVIERNDNFGFVFADALRFEKCLRKI